ncbi:hypothetical protein MTO96_051666 [Rhipicephalus appendiculatus]
MASRKANAHLRSVIIKISTRSWLVLLFQQHYAPPERFPPFGTAPSQGVVTFLDNGQRFPVRSNTRVQKICEWSASGAISDSYKTPPRNDRSSSPGTTDSGLPSASRVWCEQRSGSGSQGASPTAAENRQRKRKLRAQEGETEEPFWEYVGVTLCIIVVAAIVVWFAVPAVAVIT